MLRHSTVPPKKTKTCTHFHSTITWHDGTFAKYFFMFTLHAWEVLKFVSYNCWITPSQINQKKVGNGTDVIKYNFKATSYLICLFYLMLNF